MKTTNKKKIINDPVHGFISIPGELLFDLIEHPYLQRLRWIKQLGMTALVYPGATHTRFQHTLGCMHLMSEAVETLRQKGHDITPEESEAVHAAILMHDLGHGPFSHVLESTLVQGIDHEEISLLFMERLNEQMKGRLTMAIKIFTNRYPKKFLHQLVSSQLDMDRLDYLRRDSFYTGVSEGVVSSDRIIKMLSVANDQLVVEAKGIYSIEKFLIARRLMYWQVYLHKTALVAEKMLINILRRARQLAGDSQTMQIPGHLAYFLNHQPSLAQFRNDPKVLDHFALLDDSDIMTALKSWAAHPDKVLSVLAGGLLNRNLLAIEIQDQPFEKERIISLQNQLQNTLDLNDTEEAAFFVFTAAISNNTYSIIDDKINILCRDNTVKDIANASDMLDLSVLGKTVIKQILCYPKVLRQAFGA
ncbi:HD domain-containing protein [Geofilum rubicundum]|uniref:Deoxyguanosinetriphosphate triphosphohydrolase n=1 Tax=Geofilum rubicundum JCM 15548 TaxID=1236989 RepID=A0A0E9LR04_9BACT|nr:HD domain-containing protein [Geofilum rubicundum]GAO28002.1 deoxyguanosinetriphosphate triphosphohydrolase [Geofilum rubicundum JCM 15548]